VVTFGRAMPSNARTAEKTSVIILQRYVCDEMHGLIDGIPSLSSVVRQTRDCLGCGRAGYTAY
jgi:hypothetical protein